MSASESSTSNASSQHLCPYVVTLHLSLLSHSEPRPIQSPRTVILFGFSLWISQPSPLPHLSRSQLLTKYNMLPRSTMWKPSRVGLQHLRAPLPQRTPFQARFSSSGSGEETKLVGAMDNAFNRERLAVRQHAAQSAGRWSLNAPLMFSRARNGPN